MMRKPAALLVIILCVVPLLAAAQRAGTLAKTGDKAITKGDFFTAAESYIDALAKKPKSTKTIEKLRGISQKAYDQKLALAQGYKDSGNLEGALREYRELEKFVGQLRNYGAANFVTIDFAKTFSEVSEGAAESRYAGAEGYFAGQNYAKAIDEYKAALGLKSPYKDCLGKISESYYQIAAAREGVGSFRDAAEIYLRSCSTTPNYKDARQKAVAIYYALGNHFMEVGQFRKAYEDFSLARNVDPQYADLSAKLMQSKELATVRIAFVRFDNATGRNLAGMALGDVIMESIKSKVQARASQFIRILDRDELMTLAEEQRISTGQFSDEMSAPMKIEGVDFLLFGKLNQVRESHPGRSSERLTSNYQYSYEVPYTDSKGRQRTQTKWAEAPMAFDLIKESFKVHIGGTFKAIAVKSGAVAINKQIAEDGGDAIVYATNVRMSTRHSLDDVIIDKDVDTLLEARRELQDIGVVANGIIQSVSDAMANSLLTELDRTSSSPDPASLKY